MLDIKKYEDHKASFFIRRANTSVTLFFRDPTTEERISYSRELIKKEGNLLIDNSVETRLIYGKKVATGLNEGDFGYEGALISSNPKSENYREDWKDLIEETYSDLFMNLGHLAFESVIPKEGIEAFPLAKTSGDGKTNALPKSEKSV